MRGLLALLVLLAIVAGALALVDDAAPADWIDDKPPPAVARAARDTCPNLCSNNGRCLASGQCACNAGWTGVDCSIADTALSFGAAVTGSVGAGQFHYYHVAVSDSQNALHWLMNQTGASGEDCDLYVQYNAYPTRYSYYARDLSVNTAVDLAVNNPSAGTWFAGVYGWTACSYRFMAAQTSPCPNACSGHGTCQTGGVCACAAGYTGADCSTAVAVLQLGGAALSNQVVARYTWKYYQVTLTSSTLNLLTFAVNQAFGSQDCDLYVKKGQLPNFQVWDQRNEGVDQQFSVAITNPTPGVYYAGVFGFTECTFSIGATGTQACPNQCSGPSHGLCSGGTACACQNGYSGAMCEQATFQMQNNVAYQGIVEAGNWNYYSVTAVTQQNVQLLIQTPSSTQDCDVYIKRDTNPTRTSFDYRDVSMNQNVSITIQNPAAAVWKVGIYGFTTCSYTLSGTLSFACPLGCSGHGTCLSTGRCQCANGWVGPACDAQVVPLVTTGLAVFDQVASGYWKYYSIAGVQTAVTIHLLELRGASGFLWLLVNDDSAPTLVTYDYNSVDTNTPNHNIVIGRTVPSDPSAFVIGVYGNPLIPIGQNISYAISAFATPF